MQALRRGVGVRSRLLHLVRRDFESIMHSVEGANASVQWRSVNALCAPSVSAFRHTTVTRSEHTAAGKAPPSPLKAIDNEALAQVVAKAATSDIEMELQRVRKALREEGTTLG